MAQSLLPDLDLAAPPSVGEPYKIPGPQFRAAYLDTRTHFKNKTKKKRFNGCHADPAPSLGGD